MLILQRKAGEAVTIRLPSGRTVEVVVDHIGRRRVHLAVEAPPEVPIVRGELVGRRPADVARLATGNDPETIAELTEVVRSKIRRQKIRDPKSWKKAPFEIWPESDALPEEPGEITLPQFFEHFYEPIRLVSASEWTRADYRSVITRFCAWAEHPVKLSELSDDLVARYLAWQLRRASPATVDHIRRGLCALWRFAKRRKLIDTLPDLEPIRRPKREPECWSLEDFNRILRTAAETPGRVCGLPAGRWWIAFLLTAYDTGLRVSALRALEPGHLDTEGGWLLVPAEVQKQNADQRFKLHADTVAALKRLHLNGSAKLFPSPGLRQLIRAFRRILERAGVRYGHKTGGCFHKIRRTVATHIADKLGPAAAQEHLGHSCLSVTEAYLDKSKIARVQPTDVLPRPTIPES